MSASTFREMNVRTSFCLSHHAQYIHASFIIGHLCVGTQFESHAGKADPAINNENYNFVILIVDTVFNFTMLVYSAHTTSNWLNLIVTTI